MYVTISKATGVLEAHILTHFQEYVCTERVRKLSVTLVRDKPILQPVDCMHHKTGNTCKRLNFHQPKYIDFNVIFHKFYRPEMGVTTPTL